MKFKKFASAVMAGAMALSLTAPAFASSGKVDVAGSINLPTINVVLPTTASMIMNPYKLNVKLNPKDETEIPTQDQIVSPLMTVKNLSNIGVQVGINLVGVPAKGSTATFATGAVGNSTDKEAFVYAKFLKGNPDMDVTSIAKEATAPSADGAAIAIVTADADGSFPTDFDPDGVADTTNKKNILIGTTGKTPADGGVLGLRFFGDMVSAPEKTENSTTVSDPWTDKDILNVTMTFTFSPVASSLPEDPPTA